MSIRIREMAYHKIKLNKILSRITGKPEEQVRQSKLGLCVLSPDICKVQLYSHC